MKDASKIPDPYDFTSFRRAEVRAASTRAVLSNIPLVNTNQVSVMGGKSGGCLQVGSTAINAFVLEGPFSPTGRINRDSTDWGPEVGAGFNVLMPKPHLSVEVKFIAKPCPT